MPKLATDLATEFTNHLNALKTICLKMERLLTGGHIARNDIEQVYSGLYLDVFTAFEGLLEELFFGLLSGEVTSNSPNIVPTVTTSCGLVARDILLIGKNYLNWLPYNHTIERAKVLFQDGKPFALLSEQNRNNIQRFWYIRNAIAHKSKYSQQKFEQQVIGNLTLTPGERTPAGFLRSKFRTRPTQTQYELVIQELKGISHILCQ